MANMENLPRLMAVAMARGMPTTTSNSPAASPTGLGNLRPILDRQLGTTPADQVPHEEARAGQEIEQAQQRDHKFVTEFLIEQE